MAVDSLRYCDPIQAASQWWDKSLVSALLQHGANINSPALHYDGRTPLQAACTVFSKSEVDSRTQMALVQFMLRNNADVNAPAGARHGFTALQLAAYAGNIQLLSLLLSHGALVNTPNHYFRKCALDFAVVNGRLDALHFLLKAGALSYCHGQSGYEGAIRLARKAPLFAIVDSLHKHVRNNQELFCEQSTLAAAHAAAMEDRDWTDDMFSEEWCVEEGCKAW
ncbi:ankyrin repeat-containing domain protein [Xylaria acuta]|nr:ankyrin repeat-containing domain protein [Xylaria acuta]